MDSANPDTYQAHHPQFFVVKIVIIDFIIFTIVVSVTVEAIITGLTLYFLTKRFQFVTLYSHLFSSSIHFQPAALDNRFRPTAYQIVYNFWKKIVSNQRASLFFHNC